MSGRPLDVLEAAVGDDVEVRLKSGEIYRGTLAGYDQHMNLVLDDVVESPEATDATDAEAVDAEASADAPDGTASEGPDGPDDGSRDTDGDGSADVQDTTIIRGDNVVSITP